MVEQKKSLQPTAPSDMEELKRDLDEARRQAEDHLNGWKRAKADYLNLKKEVERERVDLIRFANAELLLELLPIVDTLDHAIAKVPRELAQSDWTKGVMTIHRELERVLSRLGLQKVSTDGSFDPEVHDAVGKAPTLPGQTSGTILEVVEPGYSWHGRLLRPARVKVAE